MTWSPVGQAMYAVYIIKHVVRYVSSLNWLLIVSHRLLSLSHQHYTHQSRVHVPKISIILLPATQKRSSVNPLSMHYYLAYHSLNPDGHKTIHTYSYLMRNGEFTSSKQEIERCCTWSSLNSVALRQWGNSYLSVIHEVPCKDCVYIREASRTLSD